MFRRFFIIVLLLFFIGNTLTFKSLIGQRVVAEDTNEVLSLDSINKLLPFFPNLGLSSTPIDMHRTIYAIKEGDYESAKSLIKKSIKINPYTYVGEYLYARLYLAEGKLDSALYYSFRSFYKWPKNPQHYKTYNEVLVKLKDSTSLLAAFEYLDSTRQSNTIYKNNFLESYNKIKIQYLLTDFDDKISLTLNDLKGSWVRSYYFENNEVVSDGNFKYHFEDKFFINPSGNKFSYKLSNDSLNIFSTSKPYKLMQSINIYYSPSRDALLFNNVMFETGKFQNQFFKKLKN
jgi:tetratricopeptide (TPR) repeat protein